MLRDGLKSLLIYHPCTRPTIEGIPSQSGVMGNMMILIPNPGVSQRSESHPILRLQLQPDGMTMKMKVVHQLRSIHKDKYTGPRYRVWSRMIANKIHDSVDKPPNLRIITGETPGAKRKKTDSSAISDALIGAATTVSKYLSGDKPELQNHPTPSKSSGARDTPRTVLGISPASKARYRSVCITAAASSRVTQE